MNARRALAVFASVLVAIVGWIAWCPTGDEPSIAAPDGHAELSEIALAALAEIARTADERVVAPPAESPAREAVPIDTADHAEDAEQETLVVADEKSQVVVPIATLCDRTVTIRVSDAETEAPLAGVDVVLAGAPEEVTDAARRARTDSAGRAELRLAAGLDTLGEFRPEGYGLVRFRIDSSRDARDGELEIRAHRAATLRGRVVDERGAPLQGVRVLVRYSPLALGAGGSLFAPGLLGTYDVLSILQHDLHARETGADGRVELPNLAAAIDGELTLDLRYEVLRQERVRFEPGEVRDVEWVVGSGSTVRGVVFDVDGSPLVDRTLGILRGAQSRMFVARRSGGDKTTARTRTSSTGAFAFENVRPGDWLVGPCHEDAPVPWLTHVEVPNDHGEVFVELRLPRLLAVEGRAVDAAGDPIAGARLQASGTGTFPSATTDESGRFRLEPVLAGDVWIDTHPIGELVARERIRARAGETDVVVVLVESAELLVRVRDEAGRPVECDVVLGRVDGEGSETHRADEIGEVAFGRFPTRAPGLYRVLARSAGGLAGMGSPVRLEAGERSEIDVTVRAGGTLRVRVASTEVRSVDVMSGGIVVERLGIGLDGLGESEPLPAGSARVVMTTKSGIETSREAVVIAGVSVDVAFD